MIRFRDGLLAAVLLGSAVGSAPAIAQGDGPTPRLLTVSGEGEAKARPDQATLSAGVVTDGKTAADALGANSRAMNAVFATLKRLGIPDKSIQTSGINVTPQYPDFNSKQPHRVIGYQVSNSVTVTVDNLDNLGPAIDALVSSGANSLGDISFSIRDPKPLMAAAREDAVKDAIAKADTLSRAAGVTLGPIVSISEGSYAAPPQPMRIMAFTTAVDKAPTPVAAGENTLSTTVSVTWEIR
ncbi:MAG TPA: SIMPL domain-containing protein [Rhizomicrobium sp.]|nr:SIMPL domain-containing protein [Rhizomicrobium sp.]